MSGSNWATIPEPVASLPALQACVLAIKENVELLTGQRGPVSEYSVDQRVLDIKQTITDGPDSLTARITQIFELALDTLNTTSLASQVTEITAEVSDARSGKPTLLARVTEVDQARATGDSALASSITTVQATLTGSINAISASGQVKLVSSVSPGGASAAYTWTLVAGNVSTGMSAIAKNDGTSAIAFNASSFGLTDSGTFTPVFSYSSGIFTFTAPVVIGSANIGNLVVGNSNLINNAATQGVGAVSFSTILNLSMTTRGGPVAVFAAFYGSAGTFWPGTTHVGDLFIYMDFVQQFVVGNNYFLNGGSLSFTETTLIGVLNPPPGVHTFTVQNDNGPGVTGVALVVLELSK